MMLLMLKSLRQITVLVEQEILSQQRLLALLQSHLQLQEAVILVLGCGRGHCSQGLKVHIDLVLTAALEPPQVIIIIIVS